MRYLGRAALGLVTVLAVAACGGVVALRRSLPEVRGTRTVAGLGAAVEIVRDGWGVAHIFAATEADAHFALGYAHAQDRLWQMEWQRRIGTGRLSEVVGVDGLEADKYLRTLGVRRAAEALADALSPAARGALEAYAAGVNAVIDQKRPLPPEFVLLGVSPEPWTPADSLSWMKMMAWNLAGNHDVELLRTRLVQAVGIERAADLLPGAPPVPDVVGGARGSAATGVTAGALMAPARVDALLRASRGLAAFAGPRGPDIGSNAWVVGGALTATGEPILANDPHLGAQIPSQWYLAEVKGGALHVVGATLPGLPLVVIGRNERVAWGLTNLGADVQDLFVERLKPDDRNAVAVGDGWAPMTVVDTPITVKGQPQPIPWAARSTRHGPVLTDVIDERAAADVTGGDDTVLALRWTGLDPDDTTFEAFLALNLAQSADDVVAAVRRVVSPCQNVVYADVDGRFGHIAPCRIPVRAAGDGTMPVPGWDDRHAWRGAIPFEALPQSRDPARGYIVNANQSVVPDGYPHFITGEWALPYRAERIASSLAAADEGRPLKALDMVAIQTDETSLYARALVPYLGGLDPGGDARRAEAIAIVAGWDGHAHAGSAAAGIVQAWLMHLNRLILVDDLPGDLLDDYLPEDRLQQQPRRFLAVALADATSPWCDDSRTAARESCDDLARRALDLALADLRARLGPNMAGWQWGRLHTLVLTHQPLGEAPLLGRLLNRRQSNGGDAFTVDAAPPNPAAPYRQDKLPGYRQIITLRDDDVGRFSIAGGQSGHPLARSYADRLGPHGAGSYAPMTLGRAHATGDVLRLEPGDSDATDRP